jgi:hypothetical protein
MKRGSKALEDGSPGGDNMMSAVQRFAGISLGMPHQFEDQTAALQLGHFATNSVLGSHVTHVLDGTGTEADPGISSLELSNAVHNAAAAGQVRRITRQTCGPTTSAVKHPPVARDAKEWHRLREPVEITSLLNSAKRDPPHSQHSKSMNSVATRRQLLWRREALKQAKLS